jgi:hypothetical protein
MMQVLERCAAGEQGQDRGDATKWAKETWKQYLVYAAENDSTTSGTGSISGRTIAPERLDDLGLAPRQIERTYRAMIRALSLSPTTPVEEPISILKLFYSRYHPSAILDGYIATPPTPFQIRMTDWTRTAESNIPPNILFGDVDVLHQRLVREGKKEEVGWLKWICKSYEVALRKRRTWRLKGRGEVGRSRRRQPDSVEQSIQQSLESGDQVKEKEINSH